MDSVAIEGFDPTKTDYSAAELEEFADQLLLQDKLEQNEVYNPVEREILIYLESVVDATSREIANATKHNVETVQSALRRLKEQGDVRIKVEGGDPPGTPNVWESTVADIEDGGPLYLTKGQIAKRWSREILNETGVPDPSIFSGNFYRSYREPKGKQGKIDFENH